MKKILYILVIVCLLIPSNLALASNTKSGLFDRTSSQYLSLASGDQSAGIKFTSDMSLSFWFKPGYNGASQYLMDWFTQISTIRRGWRLAWIAAVGTPYLSFSICDGSSNNQDTFEHPFTFSLDTWYHVVITWDASAANSKLYVNGEQESSITKTRTSIVAPTTQITIGTYSNGAASLYYDGSLDEISFWSKVLSSTDVSAQYNSGDGYVYNGNEANLEAYLRMEDNWNDTTANDNDFTANNSPTFSTDVPFAGSSEPAIIPKRQTEFWF